MSALLRDTRADAEHFARLEANFREGVELGRALASSESCADQGQRLIDLRTYQRSTFTLVGILYSRGAPMTDAVDAAREVAHAELLSTESLATTTSGPVDFTSSRSQYVVPLQLLSLAVLVDEGAEVVSRSRQLSGAVGQDRVYDVLTRVEPGSWEIAWPKPYARLAEVIGADLADRPQAMVAFLGVWYNQNRGMEWWGMHKRLGPRSAYPGYWCYEAAAVTKVLGIDDTSYRDNRYYPRDFLSR